jgi:hypothetical protein
MRFIFSFLAGIIRDALVLVPLAAAGLGYGVGLYTANGLTPTDLGQLGGYYTTVATALGALIVGLVFSAIFADPSDRFTPALRWIAIYLAVAMIACCVGLVPGRSGGFETQCFAFSAAGGAASVVGLLMLVIRARNSRLTQEAWFEALSATLPERSDPGSTQTPRPAEGGPGQS